MGYVLSLAQLGATRLNAEPWKGEEPGGFEIVEDHRGNTYRAVRQRSLRVARFPEEVEVGHQDAANGCEIDRGAPQARPRGLL